MDNSYFPPERGTTYRLEELKEGAPRHTFTVTHRNKKILGVNNVGVMDRFDVDGRLEEIT